MRPSGIPEREPRLNEHKIRLGRKPQQYPGLGETLLASRPIYNLKLILETVMFINFRSFVIHSATHLIMETKSL